MLLSHDVTSGRICYVTGSNGSLLMTLGASVTGYIRHLLGFFSGGNCVHTLDWANGRANSLIRMMPESLLHGVVQCVITSQR